MLQGGYNNNTTINKIRKVYKLSKGHSQSSPQVDSGGEELDSGGGKMDHMKYNKNMHHLQTQKMRGIVHKQPISPMSSNGLDSGMESAGKRPVTQTDSNTSTGSMMQYNQNIKSDLERKLAINALNSKAQVNDIYSRYRKNNEQQQKKKKKSPVKDVETDSENDSYIEDIDKKAQDKKHNYVSRDDFADDENDEDAKSSGSSNNGHVHVKEQPSIVTNHTTTPMVESTAIVSKKPVKIELSNQSSLGGILDSGHSTRHETGSCGTGSDKDCSCTTTSSEFQSSHHHCCSSDTSNSIKNIGNNNNNKKIVEASINNTKNIKKDEITENQKLENKKESPNRNKQYPNNSNTVATFHSNVSQRNSINNQVGKQNDYSYTNKFTATIAKVPSLNKVQPTSKRVNGVTLRDLYSLRAVLSDSDNGTVFSGRRRIDNAAVAIKRIMKGKVKRWHMIKEKSVPMEIALLRKVNETRHAGVVTLLEWFECSDCFLLVMARPTPVLDLFDYVSEKKRLDEATCKMIFVQVVEAMVHCHQRSVLHRDIKLENILVKTDTLISTIIDFGCGTHLHSNLYKDFAGTPQYYPPEYYICKQYHGLPAAVWSVGVMLYAMLCGRLPFASAHEIVHLEPSWHGSFCRKISPAAKDLVEHMLKKQPRRRLQMSEILNHRWLKNAKYDSATGDVTLIGELPGAQNSTEMQNTNNRDMAMRNMTSNLQPQPASNANNNANVVQQ